MKVFIRYNIKQNIKEKIYTNLLLHNEFNDGKYNNMKHKWNRNDGPCYLKYKNNKLMYETYYKNDKLHRLDGPTRINYETNYAQYWINGKQYENEFEYWIAVGNYRKEK